MSGNGGWPTRSVEHIAVALAAAVGMVVFAWSTAGYGLGLSFDSFAYAATAERLAGGGGLGYWLEPRLTTWAPGYPLVLGSIVRVFDTDALTAARVLHVFLVGAFIVTTWMLARACTGSAPVWSATRKVAAPVVYAFSPLGPRRFLEAIGASMDGWVVGRHMPGAPAWLVGVAVVALWLFGARVAWRRRGEVHGACLGAGLLMVAGVVVLRGAMRFDLDSRSFVPALAPTLTGAIGCAWHAAAGAWRRRLIAVLVCWAGVSTLVSLRDSAVFRTEGASGSGRVVADILATYQRVAPTLVGCDTTSNRPQLMWLFDRSEIPLFASDAASRPNSCYVRFPDFPESVPAPPWPAVFESPRVTVLRSP